MNSKGPLFLDKPKPRNTITLKESKNTVVNESKIADILNNCFSNILTPLKIPEIESIDSLLVRISQATVKTVFKYCQKRQLQTSC